MTPLQQTNARNPRLRALFASAYDNMNTHTHMQQGQHDCSTVVLCWHRIEYTVVQLRLQCSCNIVLYPTPAQQVISPETDCPGCYGVSYELAAGTCELWNNGIACQARRSYNAAV